MTKPRYGWRYKSARTGSKAAEFLVLTEDAWNRVMRDSVVVPIFGLQDPAEDVMRVVIEGRLVAICTRPVSLAHEYLGEPVGRADDDALTKVRIGVRKFLDIDRRIEGRRATPSSPRPDWWPRQGNIHFASNSAIGAQDKLYASVTDDLWNSHPSVTYTAAVRLTSRTKVFRERWEVPVGDSWVVAGDLYLISYGRFEQNAPRAPYPQRLEPDEMSELAKRQKSALSLR